jgi:hypothetical protein
MPPVPSAAASRQSTSLRSANVACWRRRSGSLPDDAGTSAANAASPLPAARPAPQRRPLRGRSRRSAAALAQPCSKFPATPVFPANTPAGSASTDEIRLRPRQLPSKNNDSSFLSPLVQDKSAGSTHRCSSRRCRTCHQTLDRVITAPANTLANPVAYFAIIAHSARGDGRFRTWLKSVLTTETRKTREQNQEREHERRDQEPREKRTRW